PRYWIGVELAKADDTLRTQLNLPAEQGLVVTNVTADGPAAKAGITSHDVLLAVADKPVSEVSDLPARLQETGEHTVTIKLIRAGKTISIEVMPQQRWSDDSLQSWWYLRGVQRPTLRWNVAQPAWITNRNARWLNDWQAQVAQPAVASEQAASAGEA